MKILYLRLKNYASIYTGLHKKEIEIDFTKSKNNIVLLVGANGSGKTSILSTLHPFAYAGNMDVRNNSSLILPDKDGLKEIHIKDGKNIYEITHFYKANKKGSPTVKSFIKRNGEELNPNGNVSSFLETVKNELHIELDYLKLLRLGSNVTNLIEMKATERKKFTSDLLSEINVYNNLFKKVNDDNRLLKGLIKSVSDKIDKLGVVDESLLETDINNLKESLETYNNDKSKLISEIGHEKGVIHAMFPELADNPKALNAKLTTITDRMYDNRKEYKKLLSKSSDIVVVIEEDHEAILKKMENKLSDIIVVLTADKSMLHANLDKYDTLVSDIDSLKTQLESFISIDNLNDTKSLYTDLTIKIQRLEEYFGDFKPSTTKDNLILGINILNEISNISDIIHSFNANALSKVFELIDNGEVVSKYVSKEIDRINSEIFSRKSVSSKESKDAMPLVMYVPVECNRKDTCPLAYYYNNLILNKDKKEKSLSTLEYEKSVLEDMDSIMTNIDLIISILKTNDSLISKLRVKYFKFDNIMENIRHNRPIYDEIAYTKLMSDVEDYEKLVEYRNKVKSLESDISNMESNEKFIKSINDSIDSKTKLMNDVLIKGSQLRDSIARMESEKEKIENRIESLLFYKEIKIKKSELDEEYHRLEKEYSDTVNFKQLISDKVSAITEKEVEVAMLDKSIQITTDMIFKKQMSLTEFGKLKEELEILNDDYDEILIIREALSSTKGIPLLYIQLYLKNTKMFVNSLLQSVYGDDFEIDDFIINADEFSIPYIKNGIYIEDVVYASQGERSFLSLALSFALINQSIRDYNILLLDEIDSTLDTRNRAMFLNILENQISFINAEQVFLITHNNMFDMYPVDIIMTSDTKLDNYRNANIIYKN